MEYACQRCGDFAALQTVGGRSLCSTCLARGDDPRVTGLRVRTVLVETLRLSLKLWRVTLWLVPLTALQSIAVLLATRAALDTGFSAIAAEWAALLFDVLLIGVVTAAVTAYIETAALPRWSAAWKSTLGVWPTLLALTVLCESPVLATHLLAVNAPGGVAESSDVPAAVLKGLLNIGILSYSVPMVIVDRTPIDRALILAPALMRRSFKPFLICAVLLGILPVIFEPSETMVLTMALESSGRIAAFMIIARALLAPLAFPSIALRSLLFLKLREIDTEMEHRRS